MAPGCVSLAALVALTLLGVTAVNSNTLHQHMSVAELQRVFHVDSHAQVPEYEVVPVHAAATTSAPPSRSPAEGDEDEPTTKHVRLSAFGQDMKLKLKKATGLFKGDSVRVWSVRPNVSEPHQVEYVDETQDDDIGDTYQDEENMAALLLQHEDDGALALEGTIGHDLVVKPVPASVRQHLTASDDTDDDEMFLDEEGENVHDDVSLDTGRPLRSMRTARSAPAHHIVYKRSRAGVEEDPLSDYAFMEPDHLSKKFRTKRSITKREAPYVIYPEILVIVDYDGYRLHGGDNVQIKRYFVSFWNGVDLRYKLLKGPKIRISIAGIIISRGRDATPYLERNRVGRDAIDSAAALTDMGKYLFRERRLPVYDIAVAVTKLDMCRRQYANDACNRGTAGFAYVGGACVVNKRLEKVNSVAIIEDTGGFSGIIVGAHEVGHLLGAVHDGSPPPSYLGGPGAEKCRWEDGFIMSDLRHTEKGFKWSACSVTSFHHFLNGDTATCLFNSPHEDESLPRVLPGKLLTLDAQCRKDRGTSACFKDDRVCAQLFCFDAGSGYCVAYRPAAEGSSCGDGQYCINGRCTTEHENIIPDYSQNTPSYLRRIDGDAAATQSRPVYASLNQTTQQRYSWNDYASTKAYTTTTTTTTPLPATPSTTKYSYNYNNNNAYSTTTKNAYGFNAYTTTTKSPFYYAATTTTTTKSPYAYTNKYYPTAPPSTAKPYDYKAAGYTPTTKNLYAYNKAPSTTKNPYGYYNKASTTKSPHDFGNLYKTSSSTAVTTTKDPYFHYKKATTTTTRNPYSYNNNNANHISTTTKKTYLYNSQYYSTTANPYAATKTTTTTVKYTPYNAYATTTKKSSSWPYYQTSATQNAEFVVRANDTTRSDAAGTECVDIATNLSGSMTCTDFLLRYAYQYCQNKYMKQNCCASHHKICESMATSS